MTFECVVAPFPCLLFPPDEEGPDDRDDGAECFTGFGPVVGEVDFDDEGVDGASFVACGDGLEGAGLRFVSCG